MKSKSLFIVLIGVSTAISAQSQRLHRTPEPVILFPRDGAQLTTNEITVSGFAAGWAGITSVQYLFNGGGPYTATQLNSNNWNEWDAAVTLNTGSNLFQVWAVGTNGLSPTNAARYFLVTTTPITVSIVGSGRVVPNLNGRDLVLDRSYTMVAVPGSGQIFAGWSGTVTSAQPVLHFVMQSNENLTATFLSSPFTNGLPGVYSGLFDVGTNLSEASSGFLTLKLEGDGDFDGDIKLDGGTKYFSGQFDTNGMAQLTISRWRQGDLSLSLSLDLTGSNGLTGAVISTNTNGFTASLQAYKEIHQASNYDGYYTWAMSGAAAGGGGTAPEGYSYGTATVSPHGDASVFLSLSDGSFGFASGGLTAGGLLPLYVSLDGGHGSLSGWLAFTNGGPTTNTMDWFKNPLAWGSYTNGFALTNLPLWLGPYEKGTNTLGSSNVMVQLSGGDLSGVLTNFTTLDAPGILSVTNTNDVQVSLNLHSGLFFGSFIDPADGANTPIRGALLQPAGEAFGFFTTTNDLSGAVSFTASP